MPRLMTDGNGNLMIDDPDHEDHGTLVKFHEGTFVPIGVNDESHNATHEQQVLTMTGTQDVAMVTQAAEAAGLDADNFAFMVNAGDGVNMHHYETQPDDAHYDGIKILPDAVAPTATSHTDAWKES